MSTFKAVSFCSLSLAALLFAPACTTEDDDSDTDGGGSSASASGGSSASASGGSSASASGGSSASTSGGSGDSGSASGGTGGEAMCYGDFSLGSVPFSGDPTIGQACDSPTVPKNCADGTFIKFPETDECVCIALCSSLGKQPGEACIDGTDWVCEKILATNAGMNSATACVNKQWNLCTAP